MVLTSWLPFASVINVIDDGDQSFDILETVEETGFFWNQNWKIKRKGRVEKEYKWRPFFEKLVG